MAEINSRENIINPEVPKVLDNEQVHVYVPKATYNFPGIAAFNESHFSINQGSAVSIKQSIMDTIGTGVLIRPDDLEEGESGLVGLANSNYRNLHFHIARKVDGSAVLPTSEDPHNTQLAIRTRIRQHNENEQAHPYIREQIPKQIKEHNEDENAHPYIRGKIDNDISSHNLDRNAHPYLQRRMGEVEARVESINVQMTGQGRIYTIATWEELEEAIADPELRVFTLRDSEGEQEELKLRLLDLVTGDTIYILQSEAPDFYVVRSDVVSSDLVPESYQDVDLVYYFNEEIAGYLFATGSTLSSLIDGGGVYSVRNKGNIVDADYSMALGQNNVIRDNKLTTSTYTNSTINVFGENFFMDDLTDKELYISNIFVVGKHNGITERTKGSGSFVPNLNKSFSSYVNINGFANYVKGDFVSVIGSSNYVQGSASTNWSSMIRVFGAYNEIYGSDAFRIDVHGGQNVINDSAYTRIFGLLNRVSDARYVDVYGSRNDYTGTYNSYNQPNEAHTFIYGKGNSTREDFCCFVFGDGNLCSSSYYSSISGAENICKTITNSVVHGAGNTVDQIYDSFAIGSNNALTSSYQSVMIGADNSCEEGTRNFIYGLRNFLYTYWVTDEETGENYETSSYNVHLSGNDNYTSGYNIFVHGNENETRTLYNSFLLGASNYGDGPNNLILGYDNTIMESESSLVVGESNTGEVGAKYLISVGKNNQVTPSKTATITVGENNISDGNNILNLGYNNNIKGNYHLVISDNYKTTSSGENTVVVGSALFSDSTPEDAIGCSSYNSLIIGENIGKLATGAYDAIVVGQNISNNATETAASSFYESVIVGRNLNVGHGYKRFLLIGDTSNCFGNDSIVVGYYSSAHNNSIAVGDNSIAGQDYSITVGSKNYAYMKNVLLVGQGNSTPELNNINTAGIAVGCQNRISDAGFALGYMNTTADRSVAVGVGNNATTTSFLLGTYNELGHTSIGVGNTNTQYSSSSAIHFALGYGNMVHNQSLALGQGNTVLSSAVGVGMNNYVYGNSIGVGTNIEVGKRSLGVGYNSSSGINSAVIGTSINVGDYSLGLGESINLVNRSVGLGYNLNGNGYVGTVLIGENIATKSSSVIMGSNLNGLYSTIAMFGSWNEINPAHADAIFTIADGTSASNRHNGFEIIREADDTYLLRLGDSYYSETQLNNLITTVTDLKAQLDAIEELLKEV